MRSRKRNPARTERWLRCCAGLVLGVASGCSGMSSGSNVGAPGEFGGSTGSAGSGGDGTGEGTPDASTGADGAPSTPELELDSTYQAPVSTGRFIWIANPTSGRVAYVDATSLVVKTVEAGNGPTTVAAVPDASGGDQVVVLNALSNDATVLRTDGTTLTSRTIPGIVAGANRLVVSPHGRFAIAWIDGRQLANARSTQGFQTLTVIDLAPGDAATAHTTLAVGFRPASVSFSTDERRAFAVTEDGVSIVALDGAAGPRVGNNVALDADPTASADTRDVSITSDGRFAVVRREGSNTVGVADLGSGALTALALSGPITDLDLTDDGTRAVAVVRQTSEVAVIPLGAAAPTPADVTHLTITGETIGQTVLTAGGAIAVLYSNAVASERIIVLSLSATPPTWRTLRVHAPVLSVIATADGRGAIVLHPADTSVGPAGSGAPGVDGGGADARGDAGVASESTSTPKAGAFSLLPLDGTHPALIQATDAPIQVVAVSPASDRTLITVRDDSKAIFAAYLGQFPTLAVQRYPLASPPVAAGVATTARRGYVAQQHPDGRITLIALNSGDARTLTGYELGARVVDWSRP
jgi:hypothetical protein